MIRATAKTDAAWAMLERVRAACTPERIDPVIERVALEILAELIEATPRRWFGQLRRAWRILTPTEGARVIRNESIIMVYLERGTANAGTGYIYPRTKQAIYVPLTRTAAAGWREGLVYGQDYVLAKRVRGIKPRNIVGPIREKAKKRMKQAMQSHIRRAISG